MIGQSQANEFGGRAIQRVIQDTVEDVISKKIIESYGGEIYYKRDGEFTEFSVSLSLE